MEQSKVAAVLGSSKLLARGQADVARVRGRTRRRRLVRAFVLISAVDAFLWFRFLNRKPFHAPTLPADWGLWVPFVLLFVLFGAFLLLPLANGRSPHTLIRPEHIDTGLTEVRGLDPQVDEVIRTLNVFLGYATFRNVLGGNPRRGVLFEGPPGTGKTYLAKAMAKQAGVPFLFVAAPAFQSMFFGMTNAKIRTFFRALRKAARREGGAIGFIEEIDAIGGARDSMAMSPAPPSPASGRSVSSFISNSGSGFVNELLIQMQSFDQPPWRQRTKERVIEWINGYLPEGKRLKAGRPVYHNILLIAATNRADALDSALLRPGRF